MYINPFWVGVFTTFVVEIIACIIYAIRKQGGKK